jgi:hypothetical protein
MELAYLEVLAEAAVELTQVMVVKVLVVLEYLVKDLMVQQEIVILVQNVEAAEAVLEAQDKLELMMVVMVV